MQVLHRLAMTDAEAEMFAEQLDDMIGFANKLQEVDTEQSCSNDTSTAALQCIA